MSRVPAAPSGGAGSPCVALGSLWVMPQSQEQLSTPVLQVRRVLSLSRCSSFQHSKGEAGAHRTAGALCPQGWAQAAQCPRAAALPLCWSLPEPWLLHVRKAGGSSGTLSQNLNCFCDNPGSIVPGYPHILLLYMHVPKNCYLNCTQVVLIALPPNTVLCRSWLLCWFAGLEYLVAGHEDVRTGRLIVNMKSFVHQWKSALGRKVLEILKRDCN